MAPPGQISKNLLVEGRRLDSRDQTELALNDRCCRTPSVERRDKSPANPSQFQSGASRGRSCSHPTILLDGPPASPYGYPSAANLANKRSTYARPGSSWVDESAPRSPRFFGAAKQHPCLPAA